MFYYMPCQAMYIFKKLQFSYVQKSLLKALLCFFVMVFALYNNSLEETNGVITPPTRKAWEIYKFARSVSLYKLIL